MSTVLPPEAEVALEKLLELPPLVRLEVSERLADSVEQSEIDREWIRVAERRVAEMRSGAVKGVSLDEMFAEAERIINESRPCAS